MQLLTVALFAGLSAAQFKVPAAIGQMSGLPASCIPKIVGNVHTFSEVCVIPKGTVADLGFRQFGRGVACPPKPKDTGTEHAVFSLQEGATLLNAVIGGDAVEGVHCLGKCTVKNVWFPAVCEDAISALGVGDVLIEGGGAQNAEDKVVQHNHKGTVTIKGYTLNNVGKLYRSCGDCTDNEKKSPRHVIVQGVTATNVNSDLVGINFNFGDTATISNVCGTIKGEMCQQYTGLNKVPGGPDSPPDPKNGKAMCRGAQGALVKGATPRC